MKKINNFTLLLGLYLIVSPLLTYGYTASSGIQNCGGISIDDTDEVKSISQVTDYSAPISGSLTCSNGYYLGGSWTSVVGKNVNTSCPSPSYASKIQCYPASSQATQTSCTSAFTQYRVFCKAKDVTPPGLPSISSTRYLALSTNQTVTFTYGPDGGAPISSILFDIENDANRTTTTDKSGTAFPFSFSTLLAHVDTQTDGADSLGVRRFTVRAKKVCDLGDNCNCMAGSTDPTCDIFTLPTYTLNLYANPSTSGTNSTIDMSEAQATQVADGVTHSIDITLKDAVGNKLVPVPEIHRLITARFDVTDTNYLNQYTLNGGSGMFFNVPTVPANSNYNNEFTLGSRANRDFGIDSTTGNYTFNYRAYSPTSSGYAYVNPNTKFTIHSIKYNIDDDIIAPTGYLNFGTSTLADMELQPLYTTAITGELKNYGISIGSEQTSSLAVTKNPLSSATSSSNRVILEFGKGARIVHDALNLFYSQSGIPTSAVAEGHQSSLTGASVTVYSTSFPIGSGTLKTRVDQQLGVPLNSGDVNYISTHISYTLGGKIVGYNGDIIGKTNYWLNTGESSNFSGIKVSGVTTSTNTGEVIVNQFGNDVTVLGSVNKASLKKDVISKVFSAISQVTPNNGSDSVYEIKDLTNFNNNNDGVKLQEGNIIYFGGLNGETVFLGDVLAALPPSGNTLGEKVTGKKTIVISGGNLYIKSNMYYNSKTADILGIVVLESPNDSTKGGNIFVDTDVTNIVGNIFIDKSIISAKLNTSTTPASVIELDGGSTFDDIKNQLHIYGSVYSENTIGGSRSNPLKCPYYVSSTNCSDMSKAQKYDLNFMRRFYIDSTGNPGKSGRVIGGGTCSGGTCTQGNPSFSRNIVNLSTDKYAKYPVVIEYQPLFATTPPPLFSK